MRSDTAVPVAADSLSVRLTIDPIRAGDVYEFHLAGVRNTTGEGCLHPEGYYTIVNTP